MTDYSAFFGYPSRPPELREAVATGARKVGETGVVAVETWEELKVAGHVIIDRILAAIDAATVSCFDVTTLNHNVMFELGYAIGNDRRVWPLFDASDADAPRRWDRMRLLTTVGYVGYVNSDDIRAAFLRDSPHLAPKTIFSESIEPSLRPGLRGGIFYLPSNHPTDASRELTRRLEREAVRGYRALSADSTESAVYPLSWYAQQIYSTSVTIAHLTAARRTEADIHNARTALIAGLARGMGKPLLMLAEQDTLAPIDYRDLVFLYGSARECVEYATTWLDEHLRTVAPVQPRERSAVLTLYTELKSIRFGEPVAENEAEELADYFVDTASFRDVLDRQTTVFVGRKGAGKTANLIRAAEVLGEDARNVVCVIKPFGYELQGIVDVLRRFDEGELLYVIEALWQYLLYTEIAKGVAAALRTRPAGPQPGTSEWDLLEYVEDPEHWMNLDFAVRLERAVAAIGDLQPGGGVEEMRERVATALHAGALQELRVLVAKALGPEQRVCVLIDNLDKAWHRQGDLDQLARLILGLLTAVGRLDVSFSRRDAWRAPANVTLSVFLRSDIFDNVLHEAREPDKIPVSRLVWDDGELLLRVIEARYLAGQEPGALPEDLWDRFFTPVVRDVAVRAYVLGRILPRPRDIVQFCSFALNTAVNARHERIEVEDILAAEQLYSQFAFEALLVENGLTIGELEAVLFEFAGSPAVISAEEAAVRVARAGIEPDRVNDVVERLRQLSFLGIEVSENDYSYAEEERAFRRAAALAKALGEARGEPGRFQIHPRVSAVSRRRRPTHRSVGC